MARHHRKSHRRHSRKAQRKSHRRHRRQQGGGSCAAVPQQNMPFAQRGGMAPFEVGGNDLLLDKPTMVQAQSFDQLGMIQEAGRLAAAAQQGGRRRRRSRRSGRRAHSARHRRQSRKSRKQQRRSQRGGEAPYDYNPMLLDKSAYQFAGLNSQWDEIKHVGAQAATN